MSQPKVSVVVPIYNVEKYLPRCMDSLLNQTLKDIEIIMVDDESPDNCPAMCDEYAKQDNRIKVIHKKNGGLGFARNSGLEIATGEYVAFLDSDDFVDVRMYEALYNTAKERELDTVYCRFNYYKNGQIKPNRDVIQKLSFFYGKEEVKTLLLGMIGAEPSHPFYIKYHVGAWRSIYSHDLIKCEKLRFYSERVYYAEDLLFNIDYLSKANNVGFLPEAFHFYCYNGNSLTNVYSTTKYERKKLLLTTIQQKISLVFDEDEYKLPYQRRTCQTLFISISEVLKYLPKETSYSQVKIIFDDSFWRKVLVDFPWKKLSLIYAFMFFCYKYKLIKFVQILACFKRKIVK